jgi:hypothetical protein
MISVIKMGKGVELLLGVLVLSFRVRAFLQLALENIVILL